MLVNCLCVGIGGFAGSVLRYLVALAVPPEAPFPAATLAVNVIGSLLLGFLAALALRGAMTNDQLSLMLRVGLCGGFTTFSTFGLEASGMLQNGAYGLAIAYMLASVALCVAACAAGGWLAHAALPAA